MSFCKKCGAELPEYAVFCTKCGLKYPMSNASDDDYAPAQPEQSVTPQTTPATQNETSQQNVAPIQQGATSNSAAQSEWFKKNSMALYVILGVVAYVLLQFCTVMVFISYGLSVMLGVFAILCAIAFCVIGIVRYVMCGKADKKHTTCDNVCLALGIIGLVYVLFMTIVVL